MTTTLAILIGLVAMVISVPLEAPPSVKELEEAAERAIPPSATWTFTSINGDTLIYTAITNPVLQLDQAKLYCEALSQDTTLASVIYADQFAFLQSKLKPFVAGLPTRSNRAAFWVAGTDLYINSHRGEGQYWFYDGRPINTAFWNINEPNDYETGPNRVPETCIDLKVPAIDPNAPFGVNDEVCTTELSFICESPAPAPASR